MDLLLILTYTAICVGIFKIFKIPLNKWTVPTAVLGGVFIIGALITLMNYNHPYAQTARDYYVSTPVVPLVKGRVTEVPVKPNQEVKQGDVLFKIDPVRFEQKVNSVAARLTASKESLKSISARLRSAVLDRDRAKELMRRGIGKQRDLDVTQANVDDITAQIDQQKATIEDLQAQLSEAQYNLDQTVVFPLGWLCAANGPAPRHGGHSLPVSPRDDLRSQGRELLCGLVLAEQHATPQGG